jgi:RNA recognition motif-containing protein
MAALSRTGDSRGFAFVRYKYADEAQKAVDRLDGGLLNSRLFRGQIWVLTLTVLRRA